MLQEQHKETNFFTGFIHTSYRNILFLVEVNTRNSSVENMKLKSSNSKFTDCSVTISATCLCSFTFVEQV